MSKLVRLNARDGNQVTSLIHHNDVVKKRRAVFLGNNVLRIWLTRQPLASIYHDGNTNATAWFINKNANLITTAAANRLKRLLLQQLNNDNK